MYAPLCGCLTTWHPSYNLAWAPPVPCSLSLSPTPFSSVSLCTCLSQCELLQYYYATWGGKKGKKLGDIFTMEFYLLFIIMVPNECRWMGGGGCLTVEVCNTASITLIVIPVSFSFTSVNPVTLSRPLTFSQWFLYLNQYLLFRLLLNLSVISKRKKNNKKNTKCLKILYRHRF